jgi:diguanylate cyclase (GGDEF)-like protein
MLKPLALDGATLCALLLGLASSAIYFLLDVRYAPDIMLGVLYSTVVLFGLLARARSVVLGFALSSTLLIGLAWLVHPVADQGAASAINRGLALFAIWAIAGMAWHYLGTQRELEDALRELAESDPLTRIMNRAGITAELARRCAEFQRYGTVFAVLLVDVDHFKAVNDRIGHLGGDHVLRRVAEIMRSALREVDSVGRYGGEEFVVVLPGTVLESAVSTAERIRLAIEQVPVRYERELLKVTVSIGVTAAIPGSPASVEQLFEAADRAMYEAKHAGRNRVMPPPTLVGSPRGGPVRAVH